jgi:uncharacterized protein YggE
MRKLILAAAGAMMFTLGAAAQQNSPVEGGVNSSYSYENSVQVTGRAERKVTPDEIYVRVVIDERELKLKKTVEQMEQGMIRSLKALGIDTDKDLKIDRMSSGYKDYFMKTGQARTTATYELKVAGAAQLGLVYQALEAEGISNMAVVRQAHSQMEKIRREMRAEAMRNAMETAAELVGAVGQKLGPAVYIFDNGMGAYDVMPMINTRAVKAYGVAEADAAYETPLNFNDMDLNYTVQVKFALSGK